MSDKRHFRCPSCGGVNRIPVDKVDNMPTCGRCKTALETSGKPVYLTDAEVEKLVKSSPVPVLVDFYADWCGPCKALGPVLDQLGSKHAGQLLIAKVDTQKYQQMAGKLGVQGIPAVFLFKGGELVNQQAGYAPLPQWEYMVGPHLA